MNWPVEVHSDSHEDSDCFPSYNGGKNVHEINAELLLATSSNQSSFIACCPTVNTWFDIVDPSGGDGLFVDRKRYQGPCSIVVNGINLGLHGVSPVQVSVGFLERKMVGLVFRISVMLHKLNVNSLLALGLSDHLAVCTDLFYFLSKQRILF